MAQKSNAQPASRGAPAVLEDSETVFVAVCGQSPAILTETVWALAHETPPLIPGRVIVLTTTAGRKMIERELFGPEQVWAKLRQALGATPRQLRFGVTADSIRLFPKPDQSADLADIQTMADNAVVADTILECLRGIADNPHTRIIASIAGGRKTMSVLMAFCLGLIARPKDRLCHVLVSPPFDDPRLEPRFFYPLKGAKHQLPNGSAIPAANAVIRLACLLYTSDAADE